MKGKDLVFYNKCLTEFVSLLEGKFHVYSRVYIEQFLNKLKFFFQIPQNVQYGGVSYYFISVIFVAWYHNMHM